jgi:hypothetical protein
MLPAISIKKINFAYAFTLTVWLCSESGIQTNIPENECVKENRPLA